MHFTRDYRKTFDVYPKSNTNRSVYSEALIEERALKLGLTREQRVEWDEEFYTPFMPAVLGRTVEGFHAYIELHDTSPILIGGMAGSGKTTIVDSIIASMQMRDPYTIFYMIDLKGDRRDKYKNRKGFVYSDELVDAIDSLEIVVEYEINGRFSKATFESSAEIDRESHHGVVVIIDEFAELIIQQKEQVEKLIREIAQKGRKYGVYLIATTQYVTPDVITDILKFSFATKICLRVSNAKESVSVLGVPAAEQIPGSHIMICCEKNATEAVGLLSDPERHDLYKGDTGRLDVLEAMTEPSVMSSVAALLDIDPVYGYADDLTAYKTERNVTQYHIYLRPGTEEDGYNYLVERVSKLRQPLYAPVRLLRNGKDVTVQIINPTYASAGGRL